MKRREFLRRASALSAAGLAANLDLLSLTAEAAVSDYKALVCVFLYGGVDGNNILVPLDAAGYGQYAAVRAATSNVQLTQAELLPIAPANVGTPFGLHPSMPELQAHFNSGKLALLANTGTLTRPMTKADYIAGERPENLYSHADQQAQWQSAISTEVARTGWGGRLADALLAGAAQTFPMMTSTAGSNLFVTGAATQPLAIPASGGLALSGFTTTAASKARLAALNSLLDIDRGNTLVAAAADITKQAQALSATVNPILTATSAMLTTAFTGLTSNLSKQLLAVAKMIESRVALGVTRQVFFVSLGGFDTHTNQLSTHKTLFTDLSTSLNAFYNATVALGVSGQVTSFTLSDFGRTFQPSAGGGSDHAWGNHHMILGGAVQGGKLYGTYPELVLGGPSDAEKEGRWLPTTSVDQYGAELAAWFGASDAQLAKVFPNLAAFGRGSCNFLG